MKLSKRLRKLRDYARELGAREINIETKRRHPRMTGIGPNGRRFRLTLARSPSCARADKNALAILRRTVHRNVGIVDRPGWERNRTALCNGRADIRKTTRSVSCH